MVRSLSLALLLASATAQAAGASPRDALARGLAALESGQVGEARAAFEEAVAGAPAWGLAQLELGIALRLSGPENLAASRAHLEQATVLSPDNPRAHAELGTTCEAVDDTACAEKAYTRAIELRPSLNETRFRLAMLLRKGNPARAIELFEVVREKDPRHLGALIALAELYEQAERLGDAETALQSVVRLKPTNVYELYRLAHFYERHGEQKKAREVYARLEAVDPRPRREMRRLR